ncbi:hypothetical protein [Actinacidiphila oryziradicis]|uniref:Uncharacterized protein n=1 Tax=Actinacidiphila oryziradicis TaxID=2571141 RepID=A0A4U0RMF8_9ACTN|nr:hypothetical protein [Actinacidiphila oryziradicis]TJZ97021.1 hypothetical protein FCI23_50265 [Actinacidiphila oryziradicis]
MLAPAVQDVFRRVCCRFELVVWVSVHETVMIALGPAEFGDGATASMSSWGVSGWTHRAGARWRTRVGQVRSCLHQVHGGLWLGRLCPSQAFELRRHHLFERRSVLVMQIRDVHAGQLLDQHLGESNSRPVAGAIEAGSGLA